MDASYLDFLADIQQYRALGASEESLQRSEGLLNLVFFLFTEFDDLQQKIEHQQAHLLRLKEMQFGTGQVIDGDPNTVGAEDIAETKAPNQNKSPSPRKPAKGHGRLKAEVYTGAEVVHCRHHLNPGDACPECEQGKLYAVGPAQRIVFTGQAPLLATRYELDRLRCALCGDYFTASAEVNT